MIYKKIIYSKSIKQNSDILFKEISVLDIL